MKPYIDIFRYQEARSEHFSGGLIGVIFLESLDASNVSPNDRLDELYNTGSPPDLVTFIVPETDSKKVINWLLGEETFDRLRIPASKNPVRIVHLRKDGLPVGVLCNQIGEIQEALPSRILTTLRHSILTQWCRAREGMMEAMPGFHYVKPSQKMADKFIRSGNVLLNSRELALLSFWIVGRIKDSHSVVWVDSGTILSIAYAVVENRRKWLSKTYYFPEIRSFESWNGFNLITHADKSVILISASSGGAMERQIIQEKQFSPRDVITIFYLATHSSPGKGSGHVTCDLTRTSKNPDGFSKARISRVEEDHFFERGSKPIPISTAGFLPQGKNIETLTIVRSMIPSWFQRVGTILIGRRMIFANLPEPSEAFGGGRPKRLHFGINLMSAWKNYRLGKSGILEEFLTRYLQNRIPATLSQIIFFDDSQSKSLADLIKRICRTHLGIPAVREIGLSRYVKDKNACDAERNDTSFSLVIASSLLSLQPFLNASQILRDKQRNGGFGYFVPLLGVNCSSALKNEKSNLSLSNLGFPNDVTLFFDFSINWENSKESSWEQELSFWDHVLNNLDISGSELFAIKNRIAAIEGTVEMSSGIFLTGPQNENLTLRDNSIFIECLIGVDFRSASQADVLFMVSSLLAELTKSGQLQDSSFKTVLLDPNTFNRFSDGVIQAAFLRSSFHGEFSYRIDQRMSARMGDVISDLVFDLRNPRAEALTEFLYAIAVNTLSLRKLDLIRILDRVRQQVRKIKNPLTRVIFRYLSTTT